MTDINRRSLLTVGAATALASTVGSSHSRAMAPLIGKQAPSFYRYKVGNFEITQIADGALTVPLADGFVTNVSKDTALAAAEAAYMPKGKIINPFNPMVINTGSKLVLIDTGWGPGAGSPPPGVGLLQPNMSAAGIDPKQIDIVLLSHLHRDHMNGLKTATGDLAFPNAEIMVPAVEWAFWMNDENLAKAPNAMMKEFFRLTRVIFAGLTDKVTKYEWGKEVVPGITSIDTNGHTPGHTSFIVASGSGRLLVQSDVTNIPDFFLRNPDWYVAMDIDPIRAAETRHKFYDMASAEKALIAGFHFPFPCLGHVEKDGTGYRLVPIAWNATL
jgi:glyoxylase-like metal-dependent hydrolase (beta-lactamase superfamily II)